MKSSVDLNCDMGELDDAEHEAALMQYITSANIACGGHAGDDGGDQEGPAHEGVR